MTTEKQEFNYNEDLFQVFAQTRVKNEEGEVISFDPKLRNKITDENKKLVTFVIDKFYGKIPNIQDVREDLNQEGLLGLMEAIPRFEPDMGFRFATYAIYWIKQAISSFLILNKGAPTTPSHVRIAYSNMLKAAKEKNVSLKDLVAAFSDTGFANEEIVLTPKMVKNVAASMNTKYIDSLDQPLSYSEDGTDTLGDTIEAPGIQADTSIDNQRLVAAVKKSLMKLNNRQRLILLLRFNLISEVPTKVQ